MISPPDPLIRQVLVVDDDEVDRARVRRALAAEVELAEAATAAEGQALVERAPAEDRPDVVLLDLRLPDADGAALLPWFEDRGLPVVMLTGVEDTAVVVDAMRRGAMDYLIKGDLDAAGLARALRRAVETAALRRALAEQQAEITRQRDRLAAQADALQEANAEARALASALTFAEQAERRRISALLHDHVQQILFGGRILLEGLQAKPEAAPVAERIGRAVGIVNEAIEATRRLSLDLTPPVLDGTDYGVAVRWLAGHVSKTYEIAVDVTVEGEILVGDREVRVLLTELVRELLFNVVKHAVTDRVEVRVRREGPLVSIDVVDEGRGFDTALAASETGFGLYSVRRRIELLGGDFSIESGPGLGTHVRLSAPASPNAPTESEG